MKLVAFLLALLFSSAPAFAQFYVSSSLGNDSNPGTQALPWKTLRKVNAQTFAPGTYVYLRGWDVWNRDEGQLVDGSLFLNSPGVHYTTYDIGRAVIDGSISASNPSDWTLVSGNVWESTRSFPPRPGFTNGLPFNNANDIGNILWNFQAVGGNSPPEAMKATSGKMTGGGVGGVWYKPGDGINNLGTVDGNWNFNTDRYTAQIVSSGGNPATVFPGIRLSINAACIEFNGNENGSVVNNIVCENMANAHAIGLYGDNQNIKFKNMVIQQIGGGNLGGGAGPDSRAGDGFDIFGTYNGITIERTYFYQMYDVAISPQFVSTGAHDNLTLQNNVMHKFGQGIALLINPAGASTMANLHVYNNTGYDGGHSWSYNQRPNGQPASWANVISATNNVTITGMDYRNNVFAGIGGTVGDGNFGLLIQGAYPPISLSGGGVSGTVWDYNDWKLYPGLAGKVQFGDTSIGNQDYVSWATTYGWDHHGLIDTDPLFTNGSGANFYPGMGSPLFGNGTNLYANGVTVDFYNNPRPTSGAFTIGAFQ